MEYTDDIVLLARDANEMRKMLKSFAKFLKRRNLILSANKSKMMTFRRGEGRKKKEQWYWNESEIEEVNHFKYLGYTLQRNNEADRHIKETVRRAISAMKQVWGIGQRKFTGDFKRRMWIFNHLKVL